MNYCIGAIFNKNLDKILLVKKNPKNLIHDKELSNYLKGKLNFIGGKLEKDEASNNAIIRECREETGLELYFTYFATLDTKGGKVYCYYSVTDKIYDFKQLEDEELNIYDLSFNTLSKYQYIYFKIRMPNLDWLIPMAINHYNKLENVKSFEIKEIY